MNVSHPLLTLYLPPSCYIKNNSLCGTCFFDGMRYDFWNKQTATKKKWIRYFHKYYKNSRNYFARLYFITIKRPKGIWLGHDTRWQLDTRYSPTSFCCHQIITRKEKEQNLTNSFVLLKLTKICQILKALKRMEAACFPQRVFQMCRSLCWQATDINGTTLQRWQAEGENHQMPEWSAHLLEQYVTWFFLKPYWQKHRNHFKVPFADDN